MQRVLADDKNPFFSHSSIGRIEHPPSSPVCPTAEFSGNVGSGARNLKVDFHAGGWLNPVNGEAVVRCNDLLGGF